VPLSKVGGRQQQQQILSENINQSALIFHCAVIMINNKFEGKFLKCKYKGYNRIIICG